MSDVNLRTKSSAYISEQIRNLIVHGHWKAGLKLASEKQLAKDFDVCPATIQKSLKILQTEGLIKSKRGLGRFVANLHTRAKTGLINIIVHDPKHIYHPLLSQTIQSISQIVTANAYHMKISALMGKNQDLGQFNQASEWDRLFGPNDIDGAIIATQFLSRRAVEWLADRVPVVSLNNLNAHPRISCVQVDEIGGAYQAVRYLISLGHKRLTVITTNRYCIFGQQQQDGARLAAIDLVSAGDGSIEVLEAKDFDITEGERLAKQWLANKERSTAVFCGSDELALGFYRVASEAGITIPNDISLVSVNDTLTLEQIPCPMTAVRSDYAGLGEKAGTKLFEMISQPYQIGDFTTIPSHLIIRNSCLKIQ